MKTKAFTLIELLVVIAIIAILAAILFPVFAQAKLAAKKTQDLSNMKNLSTASLIYATDYDDYFPRGDYLVYNRQHWAPWTWREAIGPYVKNGIQNVTYASTDSSQVQLAVGDIWASPTQPSNSRYGYGANQAVFPSGQQFRQPGNCGDNYSGNTNFNDQTCTAAPTGTAPVGSTSQTQLPRVSQTLMITTLGISTDWGAANTYMQSSLWWWQGAAAQIHGATIPPNWDADGPSSLTNDYSGNLNGEGPSNALPRFRYSLQANVGWADGHAKSKRKGQLSWCNDMFVAGSIIDPYNSGGPDDAYAFGAGQACAGYNPN